jgi:hypothetical protein
MFKHLLFLTLNVSEEPAAQSSNFIRRMSREGHWYPSTKLHSVTFQKITTMRVFLFALISINCRYKSDYRYHTAHSEIIYSCNLLNVYHIEQIFQIEVVGIEEV